MAELWYIAARRDGGHVWPGQTPVKHRAVAAPPRRPRPHLPIHSADKTMENAMRSFATLLVATTILAGANAHATGLTFQTIDNPADPTFNQLLGINNTGVISGYFGSGAVGHPNQGYTIASPYTTFVSANLPDSTQTQATGINAAGVVTGFWSPTDAGDGTDANFGFIRFKDKNQFIYVDVNDPLGAGASPVINQVLGINTAQIAVGFYLDASGVSHGFAYDVSTAAYMPIKVPGATAAAATGINNSNLVSGFFTNKGGVTYGFLAQLSGGTPVTFRAGSSTTTQLLGVNNNGIAVGFYIGTDTFPHGVIYTPSNGNWTPVNDPSGAMGTVLNGVNDKGSAVGFYTDAASNTHGMLVTGVK
jgi:hypothetical protein